jgi:hypothetical protein
MLRILIAAVLVLVGSVWLSGKLFSPRSIPTVGEKHPQVEKVKRDVNKALEKEQQRTQQMEQEYK